LHDYSVGGGRQGGGVYECTEGATEPGVEKWHSLGDKKKQQHEEQGQWLWHSRGLLVPEVGWLEAALTVRHILEEEGLQHFGSHKRVTSPIVGSREIGQTAPAGVADKWLTGLGLAAQRALLRALLPLRGRHNGVRTVHHARGDGNWAALALELELEGRYHESASARLRGVVCLVQDAEGERGQHPQAVMVNCVLQGKQESNSTFVITPPSAKIDQLCQDCITEDDLCAYLLSIMDCYAFTASAHQGDGGSIPISAQQRTGDLPYAPVSSLSPTSDGTRVLDSNPASPQSATATPSSGTILAMASILAQALCVWRYFGLPSKPLDESFRKRLAFPTDMRILCALFFPDLSLDWKDKGKLQGGLRGERSRQGPESEQRMGKVMEGRYFGCDLDILQSWPTTVQTAAVRKLCLSPRLYLAMTQACTALSKTPASRRPVARPLAQPGGGTPAGVSQVRLLLERFAERGGTAWVGSAVAMDSAGSHCNNEDRGEQHMLLTNHRGLGSGHDGETSVEEGEREKEKEEVWFTCGHHFPKTSFLVDVVPACVADLGFTSSLQLTRQLLAQEYGVEGKTAEGLPDTAEVACPKCAAAELRRMVAVLHPMAPPHVPPNTTVRKVGKALSS
ncbi:unnamed protein product, partial [Choristocarpus tenellus]